MFGKYLRVTACFEYCLRAELVKALMNIAHTAWKQKNKSLTFIVLQDDP